MPRRLDLATYTYGKGGEMLSSWIAMPLLGVDGAHGPWQQQQQQQWLVEIGGIKPLAFGQFGEMEPGLDALLASVAKRGADEQMADRYLIENREAAVGGWIQTFHVRQRWGRSGGLEGVNAAPLWWAEM
jgi:hypothetical protein